jgi:type II secretion system protein C
MGAWLIMAVNGALLGACCFLVADVVTRVASETLEPNAIVALPSDVEDDDPIRQANPSAILDRNLFGAQLTGDTQVADTNVGEPLTATKLPLRLLGTAAASREERSRAAIENEKTKKHMIVAVGDEIEGHRRVTVAGIERTRVILDNAGKPEELVLNEDQPKTRRKTNSRREAAVRARDKRKQENRNARLEKLAGKDGNGLSKILSSARIVPYYEDGKVQGMKVDAIKPDSIFEKIGFQNGDVIKEVNGIVIDRLEASAAILDEFAEADSITTAVLRGNEALTMSAETDDLLEQP